MKKPPVKPGAKYKMDPRLRRNDRKEADAAGQVAEELLEMVGMKEGAKAQRHKGTK